MKNKNRPLFFSLCCCLLLLAGCATALPYVGQGPHPQIERGHAIPPIDGLANVLALPYKLILFDWRFANHSISEDTESYLVGFLEHERNDEVRENMVDTKFRLNQYSPFDDLKRLVKNRHIGWHRLWRRCRRNLT